MGREARDCNERAEKRESRQNVEVCEGIRGKPLCPCNFYNDKAAETKLRRWMCACDEMQIYKYCHCLLFVREDGLPITEYLPEGHEGREVYGIVTDPTPDKGRALKHKATAAPIPLDETSGSPSPTS